MNKNIEEMLTILMADDNLCEEFIHQKTLDDVYDFSIKIKGGYTKEEFEEFIDEVYEENKFLASQLEDYELGDVSGGMSTKVYNKVLAYSLSALALASSMSSFHATDGGSKNAIPPTPGIHVKKEDNKQSFWQKYKKWIVGAGAVGAAALAGFLWYYYGKHSGVPDANGLLKDGKPSEETSDSNGLLNDNKPSGESTGKSSGESTGKSSGGTSDSNGFLNVNKLVRKRFGKPTGKRSVKHKKKHSPNFVSSDSINTNSKSYKWYQYLKDNITNIKYIGGIFAAAGMLDYFISDFSSVLNRAASVLSANWQITQIMNEFGNFRKKMARKFDTEKLSFNDAIGNLDYLFDEVKGQEKAKEQVKSIVFGILHRKKQAELVGKKYEKGDVLYFAGPSGVGKTLMARGLAKYKILSTNTEPFYISASEVDKDSDETVMDQLFGLNMYGGGYGYGYNAYGSRDDSRVMPKPKNLVRYLNDNPDGVVIVDEYDKMWSPALDEVFRTIVDKGVVNVKGQTIDCSGITFILTSNESTKSLIGGNQEGDGEVDDGTGSRTSVKHDKSFINRLQPVEFDNLSSKEYEKIIVKEFREELVDYWADEKSGAIEIVIDQACLENMASVVEKKNQGARYITALQSDLFRDISIKVFDAREKDKDYYHGKKIFVSFDSESQKFTLKDEQEISVEQ